MARARPAKAELVVRIRPMKTSDVPHVVAIESSSSATPWTRAMFMSELGRPGTIDLVGTTRGHAKT